MINRGRRDHPMKGRSHIVRDGAIAGHPRHIFPRAGVSIALLVATFLRVAGVLWFHMIEINWVHQAASWAKWGPHGHVWTSFQIFAADRHLVFKFVGQWDLLPAFQRLANNWLFGWDHFYKVFDLVFIGWLVPIHFYHYSLIRYLPRAVWRLVKGRGQLMFPA